MFAPNADTTTPHDLAAASQRLLSVTQRGDRVGDLLASLDELDEPVLARLRTDADAARAFWLNLHRTATVHADGQSESGRSLRVAGTPIGPDDIQHGILRAGKWKYGLGYVPNPFQRSFERRHQLQEPDPRVHVALWPSAAELGTVEAFSAANVDDELAAATSAYLDAVVDYNPDTDVARVSRLFFWFRGDFGGVSGVRSLLHRHEVVPPSATPRLNFVSRSSLDESDADSLRDAPEDPQ